MCRKQSLAFLILLSVIAFSSCKIYKDEKFEMPPDDFQESDIIGTWEARYTGPGKGVDKLIIRANGTFIQEYNSLDGQKYSSGLNSWFMKKFSDGRVYIYFENARYYDHGINFAKKEGVLCRAPTCGHKDLNNRFYDPIYENPIEMVDKLIVMVRSSKDSKNGLVLKHMWLDAEDGLSSAFYFIEEH